MPDLNTVTNLGWGAGALTCVALFGKYILPIVGEALKNALETTRAGGETLANVQKDRDNAYGMYKDAVQKITEMQTRYDGLLSTQQDQYGKLQKDWVDMKSKFTLLMYQLNQANNIIKSLGGSPILLTDDDEEGTNDKPH